MKLSKADIALFQEKILTWYRQNNRQLPWREIEFDSRLKQRDPYKILVSEVMAQQTQLSRVIPKYDAWLKRFPTIESLAEAPTRDVLLYWSGLGYNNRALRLQQTAKILISEYSENSVGQKVRQSEYQKIRNSGEIKWPRTFAELIKLPGIGEYTANALLCFAFNEQVAVVDTNVRKVILLEFLKGTKETKERKEKEVEEIAKILLPKGKAYDWNQALMDYAAAVLKKEKIQIPKQSQFRRSNRYYRGETMKLLVGMHTILFSDLWRHFQSKNPVKKERLVDILQKMEKDGLVKLEGERIEII